MPNQHTDGPGPLAIQYRDQILDQLVSGKRLSDIAPILGVSRNAISKALKDDPEYKAAMESSFDVRVDQAEDAILSAAEQVDVSRARAYHEAIKWRAGVECSKFAPKGNTVNVQVNVVQDGGLTDFAGSLIDSLRVANTPK